MKTDRERIAWLMRRCHTISNIVSEMEDEGDRVYFGSTNDADVLREISDELTDFWHSQQDDEEDNAE